MRMKNLHNPYNRTAKQQVALENEVIGELTRVYKTQGNELKRTSTEFERLMMRVILCLSGPHCTQPFREAVLTNPNIEHLIKFLVATIE